MTDTTYHYEISYGKASIPIYRVYAQPLRRLKTIPESSFSGRENTLFALEVDVEVFGDNFLPAYTIGDNSNVVATDSMKNFVLRQALAFKGATIETFLKHLGHEFLNTYPQMESLRLTGRELAFGEVSVPAPSASNVDMSTFSVSPVLFSRSHNDFAVASLDFARINQQPTITAHRCSRVNLQLLKVTGSSFTKFIQDSYTTLPERVDRPLYIYMDVGWRYQNPTDLLDLTRDNYVASEQIRDVIQVVFHEFVSESIQHLFHEMGKRLLLRFPQLAEISFEGQNRTRDPIAVSEDNPRLKVYSDPFSAYGLIKLKMSRAESSREV